MQTSGFEPDQHLHAGSDDLEPTLHESISYGIAHPWDSQHQMPPMGVPSCLRVAEPDNFQDGHMQTVQPWVHLHVDIKEQWVLLQHSVAP